MDLPLPLIAVRTSSGIQLNTCSSCSTSNHDIFPNFTKDTSRTCRVMAMSKDGKLFAWTNDKSVNVVTLPDCTNIVQLPRPKTIYVQFSPLGNILATWESYAAVKDNPQLSCNLHLWDVKSGKCLRSLVQKRQTGWCPQWSDDESLCARSIEYLIKQLHSFYKDNIVTKIHVQKVNNFTLSLGPSPCHVACYIPGLNGQPSYVRLYKYPNFEGNSAVIGSKSFFRADAVEMKWNIKGTSMLILTSTEVDKTGASYYGEQKVHFMGINGDSNSIQLAKDGPVYSAEWNPNSTEFCVVYGFMPAKATLFNLKCEPTFDFGTGPRNLVYYNCFGNMLILAGFGNLRGNVELWDVKRQRLISEVQASDTTKLEWYADGEHFLTATTSPRLRVGNGYKLWNFTGKLLIDHKCEDKEELYDVVWQPHPSQIHTQKQISYSTANARQKDEPAKQAYRPPGARGQPSSFKLQENEPPSNLKKQDAPLSKAALKNKKKRDAKKAKKEQEPAATSTEEPQANVITTSGGEGEKDKKIKSLQKKLEQIEKLKKQQKSGKTLELNQVEKIKKEDELLKELELLQV